MNSTGLKEATLTECFDVVRRLIVSMTRDGDVKELRRYLEMMNRYAGGSEPHK